MVVLSIFTMPLKLFVTLIMCLLCAVKPDYCFSHIICNPDSATREKDDGRAEKYGVLGGVDSIASDTDSIISRHHTKFGATQLLLPGALIALGAWGVDNGWFVNMKKDVRHSLQDLRGNSRCYADDYIQYVPTAAYLGLGFLNTKPRHNFIRRLCLGATSYAFMGIMVNVTKTIVNEPRPDTGVLNSFPSGHTATAFMGAELIRLEYPAVYSVGAYLLAGATAFLRMYNDRHWLNDILAGAGVGILSARMAYWMLPYYEKWLFSKKRHKIAGEARIIVPYIDARLCGGGISAVCCF